MSGTAAADGLAWSLMRTEREVGRRRARDTSARAVAASRVADAVVVLLLVTTWTNDDGARFPGIALSTWLTTTTVVAIAVRQVVLASVSAHAGVQARATVAAATLAGLLGTGMAACGIGPALARTHEHLISWVVPVLFGASYLLACAFTLLAGERIHAAMRSVDLLDGLERPSHDLVRHRLSRAFADAVHRPARRRIPRLRTSLVPAGGARVGGGPAGGGRGGGPAGGALVGAPSSVGPPSGSASVEGGFGAARRIAAFGIAAAVLGSAAEALVASARPTPTGSTLVLGWSGLPAAIWVAGAVVALALLGLRTLAAAPAPRLGSTLLLALAAFAAGVVALLGLARRLQQDSLDGAIAGPSHWIALGAFAAAASAALLTVSALCEDVRESRRPPTAQLDRAVDRLRVLRLAA